MALLCDNVMATGEDAFSNGATGGSQSIGLSGLDSLNSYAGSDDGEGNVDDEAVTDERVTLGDILVRAPYLFDSKHS